MTIDNTGYILYRAIDIEAKDKSPIHGIVLTYFHYLPLFNKP